MKKKWFIRNELWCDVQFDVCSLQPQDKRILHEQGTTKKHENVALMNQQGICIILRTAHSSLMLDK